MSDIASYLAEQAKEYWHKPHTPVFAGLAATLVTLYMVSRGMSQAPTLIGWAFIGVMPVAIGVLWWVTNRVPRITKGKVGIVLALACDDEPHDRQVRADFVASLRQLLERDRDAGNFELRVLPRHVAAEIGVGSDARNYLGRLRGHLMLFGRVRKRVIAGKDSHLLNFDGIVRHSPVALSISQDLGDDFSKVIPRRVHFEVDSDAFAFEATSQWIDVSARYIVGVAALISGDVAYAERLLLDVEGRLKGGGPGFDPLREVARRLPARFRALYEAWLNHLVNRYTQTRETSYLEKADEITEKLLKRNPRHSGALLMRAICEFVLRRDVAEARRLSYRARRVGDATWRYSVAFLDAYEGNMNAADAEYQKAFGGQLGDVTVPVQCEEFIHIVLEQEPDKVQLHYCSGLINFHAKEDFAGAAADLELFLRKCPGESFSAQRNTAKNLLEQAKKCTEEDSVV